MSKIIIIDASSTSLGGGLTYLTEFLNEGIKSEYTFEVICSRKIIPLIPESNKIKKITHSFLNGNIFKRYLFKVFIIDSILNKKAFGLISLSGDYLGSFEPYVGVCQNMLLYEKDKRIAMRFTEVLKFELLKKIQIKSFKNSNGVIFLSNHAKNIVSPFIGYTPFKVINFGISKRFLKSKHKLDKPQTNNFLYISSIHTYKNQLILLKAFKDLVIKGHKLSLTLVGPILSKKYWLSLKEIIDDLNRNDQIIYYHEFINYEKIHTVYSSHKYFIFPSICENMPNIVLEAAAARIPIISSFENPMPEFLNKNAVYFNSNDIDDIKEKILYSLNNYDELKLNSKNAYLDLKKYSWKKNFTQTVKFIESLNELKK